MELGGRNFLSNAGEWTCPRPGIANGRFDELWGGFVELLGSFDELLGSFDELLGSFDERSGRSCKERVYWI